MNEAYFKARLPSIKPVHLDRQIFVRAYNTNVKAALGKSHFFDCEWSFTRGYRYNFKETMPVLYLAADQIAASFEIGPRTRDELLLPHLSRASNPFLYVSVRLTGDFLDLTNAALRAQLHVQLKELLISTEEWEEAMDRGTWATTHVIGRCVAADPRFAGILYPPYPIAALGGIQDKQNVALFMDATAPAMARPRHPSASIEAVDDYGILRGLGLTL